MIKIGILSLPLNWNYGGILQQYALSYYLKKRGLKPIIISRRLYRPNKLHLSIVKLKWFLVKFFGKLTFLNFIPILATEKFKQDYLNNRTQDFFSSNELSSFINKEKIKNFVVGSDQIWNRDATPSLKDSFLGFIDPKNKNITAAYAVSFAHKNWKYSNNETKICQKLSNNFDYISVREKSGVKLTKKYLKKKSIRVLDPVFLIEKQAYLKVIEKKKIIKNKLFCYILDKNIEKKRIINEIKKIKNFQVFNFLDNLNLIDLIKLKLKNYNVPFWIQNFYDSETIITDSYHGMLFSIIFKKNFYIFLNKKRGADRFISLLHDLKLKNRIIDLNNYKEVIDEKIDWHHVDQKLKKLKILSFNYINNIIQKIKNNEKSRYRDR